MRNPDNENAIVIISLPFRNLRNVTAERLHKSFDKIVQINVLPTQRRWLRSHKPVSSTPVAGRNIFETEMCIHRKTVFYRGRFNCG